MQCMFTKKLLCDSPGLVDFAVRLLDFTPNLPEANERFGGNFCFEIWSSSVEI